MNLQSIIVLLNVLINVKSSSWAYDKTTMPSIGSKKVTMDENEFAKPHHQVIEDANKEVETLNHQPRTVNLIINNNSQHILSEHVPMFSYTESEDSNNSANSQPFEKLNSNKNHQTEEFIPIIGFSALSFDGLDYRISYAYYQSMTGLNEKLNDRFFTNDLIERLKALINAYEENTNETVSLFNDLSLYVISVHSKLKRVNKKLLKILLTLNTPNDNSSSNFDADIFFGSPMTKMRHTSTTYRNSIILANEKAQQLTGVLEKHQKYLRNIKLIEKTKIIMDNFNLYKNAIVNKLEKIPSNYQNSEIINEGSKEGGEEENDSMEIDFDLEKIIEKIKQYYAVVKLEVLNVVHHLKQRMLKIQTLINDIQKKLLEVASEKVYIEDYSDTK